MRVLGVDPGLTRCGVAVVDGGAGRKVNLVLATAVRTSTTLTLEKRLLTIADAFDELFDEYRPDAVAIEQVYSQDKVRTFMGAAQAAGVVLVAAARRGLVVTPHTPSEVKAAVTGSGRAEKAQVGVMVARVLGLDGPPKPADAADACAIAICHLWRGPANERMKAAAKAAPKSRYAEIAGLYR